MGQNVFGVAISEVSPSKCPWATYGPELFFSGSQDAFVQTWLRAALEFQPPVLPPRSRLQIGYFVLPIYLFWHVYDLPCAYIHPQSSRVPHTPRAGLHCDCA